jgi:hypothetical protein
MTHKKSYREWGSTERLLAIVAQQGEMTAQEFVSHVPRIRGDYLDFYPAAALLHAKYIGTDVESGKPGKMIEGSLGLNTHETAVSFCQFALPAGESFQSYNAPRNSWHDFPCCIFITAEGYLRLDELKQRDVERKRKRGDYIVSIIVAILAALLSSYLTHYYASKRLQLENPRATVSRSESPTPIASPR